MKTIKNTFLILGLGTSFFLLSTKPTSAQIADPGFENWDSIPFGPAKNFLPEGWAEWGNVINGENGTEWPVTRTTDARTGNYAIQLKNVESESFSAATIMTYSGEIDQFITKIPVSNRFTKFEGYYKYETPGDDAFQIIVIMFNGEDIIGIGELNESNTATEYTKFSVPIIYMSPASVTPDSVSIVIKAGKDEDFVIGSTLIIDDVTMAFASGLNDTHTSLDAHVTAWPNPASDIMNIAINGHVKGAVKLDIYNTLGTSLKQVEIENPSVTNSINLSQLPKGLLFIKISDGYSSKTIKVLHH
jgi:hypothetical protein